MAIVATYRAVVQGAEAIRRYRKSTIRETLSATGRRTGSIGQCRGSSPHRAIGICLPKPLDSEDALCVGFFEQLWRGIGHQADLESCRVLHCPPEADDRNSADSLIAAPLSGVILRSYHAERAAALVRAGGRAILLCRPVVVPEGCIAVHANEQETVDLALSHLWNLGHRRIAYVAGPVGTRDRAWGAGPESVAGAEGDGCAIGRLDSYQTWMWRRQAYDPQLVELNGSWFLTAAVPALERWMRLASPPTAIFCANDALAIKYVSAAESLGLRIPGDLSIVGVDDSQEARDCTPALTSVQVPLEEIARAGISALIASLGHHVQSASIELHVHTISVRASTGPPRRTEPAQRMLPAS